jgi:hypothetical protein
MGRLAGLLEDGFQPSASPTATWLSLTPTRASRRGTVCSGRCTSAPAAPWWPCWYSPGVPYPWLSVELLIIRYEQDRYHVYEFTGLVSRSILIDLGLFYRLFSEKWSIFGIYFDEKSTFPSKVLVHFGIASLHCFLRRRKMANCQF